MVAIRLADVDEPLIALLGNLVAYASDFYFGEFEIIDSF